MAEKVASSRKVLIPVDGSVNAGKAFEYYMGNVYRPNDQVVILHVFEIPPLPYSSGPFIVAYQEEWSAMVKEARQGHEAMLKGYEKQCKEKKCHYEVMMVVGKPAGEEICKIVKEKKIDMVIMGTRGQGVLRRTILGSVSDYVVHHAHIPVAIVPNLNL